jgi:replicative DNA helicase
MAHQIRSEKPPPQALEMEDSVLCYCLLNGADDFVDLLSPDDFYKTAHQLIFSAISSLHGQNKPVDLNTVVDELRSQDQLENAGGAIYLASILDTAPMAIGCEHYAERIIDQAARRRLIVAAQGIIRECYEGTGDAQQIADLGGDAIRQCGGKSVADDFTPIGEVVGQCIDDMEAAKGGQVTGVATGFHRFDLLTCGFQPGDLNIIAARPSMGKTALAWNMAVNIAKNDEPVLFYSLEMRKNLLGLRGLSSEARINGMRLRSGKINKDGWLAVTHAAGTLTDLPLYVNDRGGPAHFANQGNSQAGPPENRLKSDFRRLLTVGQRRRRSPIPSSWKRVCRPEEPRQRA